MRMDDAIMLTAEWVICLCSSSNLADDSNLGKIHVPSLSNFEDAVQLIIITRMPNDDQEQDRLDLVCMA